MTSLFRGSGRTRSWTCGRCPKGNPARPARAPATHSPMPSGRWFARHVGRHRRRGRRLWRWAAGPLVVLLVAVGAGSASADEALQPGVALVRGAFEGYTFDSDE